MTKSKAPESDFHHEAFFYGGPEELLAGAVPFVRAGLEAEESILVALTGPRLKLLRDELGREAERVQFASIEELARNPARIIPLWRDFLAANLAARKGVRGVGEPVWGGRSAAELDECERHESLLNLAFGEGPAWPLLCPYDTAALSDEVLRSAEHNHPVLSRDGELARSDLYLDPRLNGEPFQGRLSPPAVVPSELPFTVSELGAVRRFLARQAEREGLRGTRLADLVLAANEVATNSIQHGGGGGTMLVWPERGALVCEVRDEGRITQPLVGRERPQPGQVGGRGVWLANQLCDLVQIRSGDAGSVVRLRMSTDA